MSVPSSLMLRRGVVRLALYSALVAALVGLIGCGSKAPPKADMPPPMVTVAPPDARTVTGYESFKGRVEPIEQVDIRARVSGYLISTDFQPGSEVTKGQVLFQIDPESYKADLARARAGVATAEADQVTAEADLGKAESRVATNKLLHDRQEAAYKAGSGSTADRDNAKGAYDDAVGAARSAAAKIKVAKAKIDEAKAAARTAELDLGYCTITSPIAGVVGDRLVTSGNLVTGGQGSTTLLTTVVSVDPVDVSFEVDENTLQRILQTVREGKVKLTVSGQIPVELGLEIHGTGYPMRGFLNFTNNRVDPKTGTLRLKGRFDNPKPATGPRVLVAGMYARVRVPLGEPAPALLVPEDAVGSDQGNRFLYVVGADSKAVRLEATVGVLEGNLRVIQSVQAPNETPRPLRPDEQVIVTGLQRIRPGLTVDPKPAKK